MGTSYPGEHGHGRGKLRIYLGAAPGVGKTYAMLAEGQRRRARGTDVVGALIETHGRRLTAAMAEGLEIVPRRTMNHRGATLTEMDLDAVLARHPRVALVDELAHTNVPGCRHTKRWQDVDELLESGIDVITTLNIQHLESLSTVARQVTGVEQRETLPDDVARRADQIELVDMTPEALRRRMVHGNVYPPNRIEAALTHYFRPGNLTALRELALLWVADRVEEGMQRYRAEHGIAAPWETRERIVVGIAGEKGDEAVIRRAARIAARTPGSDLLAVHVDRDDGLAAGISSRRLEEEDAEAAWHAADLQSRTALLAATGENAHEQLAGARTALTTLAASEDHRTVLAPADRVRLLAEAARAVDQVSRLVDDLRDLSRLHAGAVETYLRPVDLDEVLAACMDDLGPGRQEVALSLAEDLPDVIADATLLTRILTSLLADAVHRCLAGPPPVSHRLQPERLGRGLHRRPGAGRARRPGQPGAPARHRSRRGDGYHAPLRAHSFRRPDRGHHPACRRAPDGGHAHSSETSGRRGNAAHMTHKNDRVLSVKELARVEGEGALYLRASGNRVEEARLDIYEPPRFFEAFLRGRAYTEPPDITARICGICPVAYQMSACQALEDGLRRHRRGTDRRPAQAAVLRGVDREPCPAHLPAARAGFPRLPQRNRDGRGAAGHRGARPGPEEGREHHHGGGGRPAHPPGQRAAGRLLPGPRPGRTGRAHRPAAARAR